MKTLTLQQPKSSKVPYSAYPGWPLGGKQRGIPAGGAKNQSHIRKQTLKQTQSPMQQQLFISATTPPAQQTHPPSIPSTNRLKPTVVCGPSGVGKGTLLGRLKKHYPAQFAVTVSHTTRKPRPGEIDGVHYHFVTMEEFERKIGENAFVEYARVNDKCYGTSFKSVEDVSLAGRVCLLEIDYAGAQIVKSKYGDGANYLFVTVSAETSEERLDRIEARLRSRGTETDAQVRKRITTAKQELEFLADNKGFFDMVLHNDKLDEAVDNLCGQFKAWYPELVDENVD